MKTSALKSNGEGLVYRGGMVFRRDTDGSLRFESAPLATGRMTADGIQYHITDHLGSVRAVIDAATGDILEASEYTAFGERTDITSAVRQGLRQVSSFGDPSLRHHFSGKEDQEVDFNAPYTDFGARQYSPSLRRWMVPDPSSEKYYDISPYVYCAGDPMNYVDPNGLDTVRVNYNGKTNHWDFSITLSSGDDVFLVSSDKMMKAFSAIVRCPDDSQTVSCLNLTITDNYALGIYHIHGSREASGYFLTRGGTPSLVNNSGKRVPDDTYPIERPSPQAKIQHPGLLGKASARGVRFHPGNNISHSEGCFLLSMDYDMINGMPTMKDSRKAVELFDKQLGASKVWVNPLSNRYEGVFPFPINAVLKYFSYEPWESDY